MKISQNWLKKYVDFKLTPEQFTEKLSMLGLEVEGYEDLAKKYENFVVGEVLERAKHPNADRLSICKVNISNAVQAVVHQMLQQDKKLSLRLLVQSSLITSTIRKVNHLSLSELKFAVSNPTE